MVSLDHDEIPAGSQSRFAESDPVERSKSGVWDNLSASAMRRGRQLVVPIDQVEVHYVGNQAY